MKYNVDKERTLLINGPASLSLISGKISVLGAPLHKSEKLIIREGKRLPLWIEKKANLNLFLGEEGSIEELDAGPVPLSWKKAVNKIQFSKKPISIMVIGGGDSGKSSFCTFFGNKAVMNKVRIGIIDADLGQSDIGPPGVIGFSYLTKPIKDLFEIEVMDAVFLGSTSPTRTINVVIDSVNKLKDKILNKDVDVVIINTDGWIEGNEAIKYKLQMAKKVSPNLIIALQTSNELVPILNSLEKSKVIIIQSPQSIHLRTRKKRKLLREISYKKYLKEAKTRSLSINWIKIKNSILGSGNSFFDRNLENLCNLLETKPLYTEETPTRILIVLSKNSVITKDQIINVQNYFKKRVKIIREGDEEGLLVGVNNEEDIFLGIGILDTVDYKRKILKVYTPVKQKISFLYMGQIKLDKNFREIGLSSVYSN